MEHHLKKKIQYFLNSPYRGRDDVRRTVSELRAYGDIALIGGMLRDVALFGNAAFRSDLDFVIVPDDLRSFEQKMRSVGARVNRFGGYSLPSKKWQIDVWPLENTWAHQQGHIHIRDISDLREATFFSCDAIIYDLDKKCLHMKEGYFDHLARKILEINLRPNPNPKGNAVRAIRYALLKDFKWGPKLSRFVSEVIDEFGWDCLRDYELRSFKTSYLDTLINKHLKKELDLHINKEKHLFDPKEFTRQVQLFLPNL
ncbi:hypothetical protein [Nitratireductor sp. L15S-10]|uniref:hypothetical protein n=1 Tax=Nitratireductor sp. L15S-10 TaxID=3034028 RepID=UPI0038574871